MLLSLSACCLRFNVSPAFLCRCGKQPTSAGFFLSFRQRNLNLRQNIQALSSSPAMVRRGSGKRSRDSKMTTTLFFLTLISLEDKWNHMLAAVLGRKTEKRKKEATFNMMLKMGRNKSGQLSLMKS